MQEEQLRILVVDDELGMRMGVTRALRNFSVTAPETGGTVTFIIDQAESGEEALEKISRNKPDILLLDHMLPGISGLDLLENLNGHAKGMLTVMITAYASIETAIVATKRGAYDFLTKPFTPQELKAVIRKAAGRTILAREAKKLAEEKKRIRFEFIRVLGHELKAPLNAVEGYLELIRSETLGAIPEAYMNSVNRSIIRLEHMRKLIADLLDMTRIESGTKTRDLAEIDLVEVAHESIETMQPMADERQITMALHCSDKLPFLADRSEMSIVFNNLISNAVKYNRDGGRVDVDISANDSAVTISVRDNGIGMTKEESAKLFEEFVRIKNAKTRKILGSGLGLSILKKIAQLYGGDVLVESEPNIGSTFAVTLCSQNKDKN